MICQDSAGELLAYDRQRGLLDISFVGELFLMFEFGASEAVVRMNGAVMVRCRLIGDAASNG